MPSMKARMMYALMRSPPLLRLALRCRGRLTGELEVMIDHVKTGEVVFDIGANRGYFTQFYSGLVGRGGKVYAFEPIPPTMEALRKRMEERLAIRNVEFSELALSDANGTATMYLPERNHGLASLRPHRGVGSWAADDKPATFECRQIRLDDFAAERGIDRLDFLKCDVEGAELLVLRGGAETLKRLRPTLYLEVNPDWTSDFGYEPSDLVDFLQPLGYARFMLVKEERISPQPTDREQLKGLAESANLLCLP